MFLKNKNIIFKIRRSKVTDYAALRVAVYYFSAGVAKIGPLTSWSQSVNERK